MERLTALANLIDAVARDDHDAVARLLIVLEQHLSADTIADLLTLAWPDTPADRPGYPPPAMVLAA